MRQMQGDDDFDELHVAMKEWRLVPSPGHPKTPPDDWMHYLWEGRARCFRAKGEIEQEVGPLEIWSLQDGEGADFYVQNGANYVDYSGRFLLKIA